MKVDGNEQGIRPLAVTPPGLPPPAAAERQQFERLLAKEESGALLTRWKEGTPLEALLEGHSPATRRELLWQVYQQGDKPAVDIGKQLFSPVNSKLIERFGERQPPVVDAIDLPELRATMREFDPLASRRQTVLLNLLRELKEGQDAVPEAHQFLDALARRELMTLIPHNSMVDNLMRNLHKLDLET